MTHEQKRAARSRAHEDYDAELAFTREQAAEEEQAARRQLAARLAEIDAAPVSAEPEA